MFSELANIVLQNSGVVYGAAFDETFKVVHICIREQNELLKLCGAKYAQSVLEDTFHNIKKYLESNKNVLFAGTPCQVAGLKKYLHRDYTNLSPHHGKMWDNQK